MFKKEVFKERRNQVLLICIFLTIVLFVLNLIFDGSNIQVSNTDALIKIKEETFTTLYPSVGEKTIISASKGSDDKSYYVTVVYSELTPEEINAYFWDLKEEGYLLIEQEENMVQVAKETNGDKILIIEIIYSETATTIKYALSSGTIEE